MKDWRHVKKAETQDCIRQKAVNDKLQAIDTLERIPWSSEESKAKGPEAWCVRTILLYDIEYWQLLNVASYCLELRIPLALQIQIAMCQNSNQYSSNMSSEIYTLMCLRLEALCD